MVEQKPITPDAKTVKIGSIKGYRVYYKGNLVVDSFAATKPQQPVKEEKPKGEEEKKVIPREPIVDGFTVKIPYDPTGSGKGNVYLVFNFNSNGDFVELFINSTKTNPDLNASLSVLGRLISLLRKYGAPVEEIIRHLKGIDSGNAVLVRFPGQEKGKFVKSIYDLVGLALEYYANEEEFLRRRGNVEKQEEKKEEKKVEVKVEPVAPQVEVSGELCPECGSVMVQESGCWTCKSCGYSKCG